MFPHAYLSGRTIMPESLSLSHHPLKTGASKWVTMLVALTLVIFAGRESVAQQRDPDTPLPRFVSTRSQPVNVRLGPGTRYDVIWEFKKRGLPVEIIQEFDVWRKIRYVDGEEGWIRQNLLTGRRTGLTRPFGAGGRTAIYDRPEEGAKVRAWLQAGFLVNVNKCVNGWCAVDTPAEKDVKSYKGYVVQFELWGVYPDETIE